MHRRLLRFGLALACGFAALQAAAEVKVILKDGRIFSLPLSENEIDRLEVDGDPWRPESRDEKVRRVIGGEGLRSGPAPKAPAATAAAPQPGGGRVLKVGPTRDLQTPGVAAKMARDGDVIEIDAGTYAGDVAIWRASNLTIRGVGGRPNLDAAGQSAEGKAIWVTKGANIAVENVAFLNARVRDKNGAGIRAEGPNLTVRRCLFKNDEMGILAGDNRNSTIVVESSEFADMGHGDGYSHAIYVNHIDSFVFRFNYVHGTKVGHHVKTRALHNVVAYNLLYDGETSTASYAVDLNDALTSVVLGNVIHQGSRGENNAQVNIIAKNAPKVGAVAWIVNNTVLNDRSAGIFVLNHTQTMAEIRNNLLVGPMQLLKGRGEAIDNIVGAKAHFVAPERLDFRLKPGSPAVDAGGKPEQQNLTPEFEYVHPLEKRKRSVNGKPDAGAYELAG